MRKKLKLTLLDLEKKCGVSATTINRMERGDGMGTAVGAFLQICEALDTSVAEMLRAGEEE